MSNLSNRVVMEANRLPPKSYSRRNLGLALGYLLSTKSITRSCITEVLTIRRQLAPELLTSLLLSSLQYLKIKGKIGDQNYGHMTVDEWKSYVENIFDKHGVAIKKLLKEKFIQLFILNRYFPLKILSKVAFNNSPISILDVGCSLNLGLAAISKDCDAELFKEISVYELPSSLYIGKIDLKYGLGIDLFEPDVDWIKACIWPEVLDEEDTIEFVIGAFKNKTPQLHFEKIDVLKIGDIPELTKIFDIVIASAMMYQLNSGSQIEFISNISKVVKNNGFLLVNDYPVDANAKNSFSYATDVYPFKKGVIQKPLNILRVDSPFYRKVKPGFDFQIFLKKFSRKIK